MNNAYYAIKPILPLRLRLALRRWRAARRRSKFAAVWPIDESAGIAPPHWPGWPEGKRFAIVLTHDVEGERGLARVDRLMRLEQDHGFRSSFNFVPEGEYKVSETQRRNIELAGFEVGIHGLQHDGKLYRSRRDFRRKAAEITRYRREWGASGFRSPLMQHRLPWLHDLGMQYDLSTFDTDPFEPEPDGVGTIFPFWVPGPDGSGYVELPYTLPQDHGLFIVLGERDNEIWKKKLDWIALRGGMALLNTHPDYMGFDGKLAADEFPISHYEGFLRYLRERYEGQFWNAVPRDAARYYTSSAPAGRRNTRQRICMVTYSHYETDSRVRRYAETLARRGDYVEVIALADHKTKLGEESLGGIRLNRIQQRQADERSKWAYFTRLTRFLMASSLLLARRHSAVKFNLVHVHNIPDFLVFSALFPKCAGAKTILDIHDIVPELFVDKFGAKRDGIYAKLLRFIERASAAFADHVIVANHLWREKLVERSVPGEKCSVSINYVDPELFYKRPRTRENGKFVLMFPGAFQWHQGLDIAMQALVRVRSKAPNVELHLYGSGRMEDDLRRLSQSLGLNGAVQFHATAPLDEMPAIMSNADLGIVPKRADSFGNEAYSTKIPEFLSVGVPVVASRTKIDSYYFNDRVVRFFPSGDAQSLADAILELVRSTEAREAFAAAGYEYVRSHSWGVHKQDYLNLIDSLITR